MALIVDTGPLVAMLDASDPDHGRCAELLNGSTEPRLIPICVLVEVEYALRPWPHGFQALLADIAAGAFSVIELPTRWLLRAGELVDRYRHLRLGLVDATVIAASEMLAETKIATLDRRHFGVVRPSHTEALLLLPQ
jgi:predicted nucleic acid-binding protein